MRNPSICTILLALLSGCGPTTAPITGTVRYAGQPVAEGVIVFEPADGLGPSSEGKIQLGRYSLDGSSAPTLGKKVVRIHGFEKTGKKIEGYVAGVEPGQLIDEIRPSVPARYNHQSKLTADILAGNNQTDFDLPK